MTSNTNRFINLQRQRAFSAKLRGTEGLRCMLKLARVYLAPPKTNISHKSESAGPFNGT
jgi:hypothetical protein